MSARVCAAAALLVFAILVVGDVVATSPTYDETTHLVSGLSYWRTGDYRLNPEHPPLMKLWAALPVRATWPSTQLVREAWAMALVNLDAQWVVSDEVLSAAPNDPDRMFLRARLAVAVAGVLLGVLVFLWSRELWGGWGGVVSVVLFAFDPNFIAHSGLVTTDVGVSLFIFATVYFFWRWTRSASPVDAALFVVSCALAVLAKFSAVLLVPILLVLAFHAWRPRRTRVLILGATCLVVALLAIWGAYRFRWSAAVDPEAAARDEDAARATLSQPRLDAMPAWPRGHFPLRDVVEEWSAKRVVLARGEPITADTIARARKTERLGMTQRAILFAAEHRLLPEAYLFGAAWVGSTSMNRASYLNGEYSDTGFRTFFFWTTLYKLPIGALIAMIVGVVIAVRARVTPFVIWPAAIYLAFTLASNLNIGHRHILPTFPFLYVACGALAGWKRKWITAALLAAAVVSTSLAWSRHLSYINLLGTRDKLTDSNFDWGQDLKRLPAATHEPVHLVYFGTARPAWYGIPTSDSSPLLAISQAHELGAFAPPAQRTYWRDYLAAHHARRVGAAGDTIAIYKLE